MVYLKTAYFLLICDLLILLKFTTKCKILKGQSLEIWGLIVQGF